ncbi:hypothetical protein [Paraburkholderia youngii]|uniref:hypothetical protein n=1 Tax=Paraburkholderia youngii TaxID=2782701 RepID=UPI003D1A2AAC
MSKRQPSLGHHLDEIAQAEFVPQIPAHTKNDHVAVEVTTRKQAVQILPFAHRGLSNWSTRHSNRFVDRYLHHSPYELN